MGNGSGAILDHLVIQAALTLVSAIMNAISPYRMEPPAPSTVFRGWLPMSDLSEGPDWPQCLQAVAHSRDRAAFEQLFNYFAPRIKTLMRRSGMDDAAAEELAQEALLAVWRKAHMFDPATTGVAAWIFTIARNLRIDALRRGRGQQASNIDAEFLLDGEAQADAVVAAGERENRVRQALAALPPEQVKVVELSFYQEQAHGEIAVVLGIPLGTVKSRLRLAMTKLRGLLGDLE